MSRSLIFIFGCSNSEVEGKSTPSIPYRMKPSGLLSDFFLVKKGSDNGASIVFFGNLTVRKITNNLVSQYTYITEDVETPLRSWFLLPILIHWDVHPPGCLAPLYATTIPYLNACRAHSAVLACLNTLILSTL